MPLPLFIKWDDAEYGLRALAAGFPTVSLPGAAIWHLSWGDKDDASDWQAYFHIRNRLIAAALHSPHKRGGTIFRSMLKQDLRFLITLQYSTVELHQMAYRDFLAGPGEESPFDLDGPIMGGGKKQVTTKAMNPGCYKYDAGAFRSGTVKGMSSGSKAEIVILP